MSDLPNTENSNVAILAIAYKIASESIAELSSTLMDPKEKMKRFTNLFLEAYGAIKNSKPIE